MTKKTARSFRTTVMYILGSVLLLFLILLLTILYSSMTNVLEETETETLNNSMIIALSIIDSANVSTSQKAEDIAYWNEAIRYAMQINDDFPARNWPIISPRSNPSISMVVIKNAEGKNLISEYYDHAAQSSLTVPSGLDDYLTHYGNAVMENARTQYADGNYDADLNMSGIVFFEDIPYYLSIAPITIPGVDNAIYGTVSVGNRLDDAYFQELTQFAGYTFGLEPAGNAATGDGATLERLSQDEIMQTVIIPDIDGNPIRLWIKAPRTTFQQGQQQIFITGGILIGVSFLFICLMYFYTTRQIARPIERLSKDIQAQKAGDLLDTSRYKAEEFLILSGEINGMVSRLNDSMMSLGVFDHILNGMNAYLYVSDPTTGEVIFINDKMCEHFGISAKSVGRPCWTIMPGQSETRCLTCPLPALYSDPNTPVIWEENNARTEHYYRNTDSFIDWIDGRKVHLHHRVDITDIKKAEQALTRRLAQQQIMSRISRGFIEERDADQFIRQALQLCGEFMDAGRTFISPLDTSVDSTSFAFEWTNPAYHEGPVGEVLMSTSAGNPIYDAIIAGDAPHFACDDIAAVDSLRPLLDSGIHALLSMPIAIEGAPWGIISVTMPREAHAWSESDIVLFAFVSSVIAAVLDRQASDEMITRMSSIAESSPYYIAYVNRSGGFEYVNRGASDTTGYSLEELTAGGMAAFCDDEAFDRLINELFPIIYAQGSGSFEIPYRHKNGEMRIMNFSSFTIDSHPDDIGTIGTDVTEQRRLEQDLVTAKDDAERSNLAKSEFLSRMSHEMRTPMNAIIGMTNIARNTADLDRKEYCLEKIDEASSHLLGVINDILDMSKIEANKFELSYTDFGLEKMLQKVTNISGFRIDEKDQTLIVHIDPNLPGAIVSDEQRLAQVITNLLSNATKFTPESGTITLSVMLLGQAGSEMEIEVRVSDTGIGISDEQKARLFNAFEQADGSISRKFGGTGLGLAISKRIIEMMGGEIHVESEEGKGSQFIFTIKAEKGKNGPRERARSAGLDLSRLRMLVVDDAPEMHDYFSALAERFGFTCDVASNGYDGAKLVLQSTEPYDIAFIDWKMPGMDGLELTRHIKEVANAPKVIIMISGADWDTIEAEAHEAGVDKFIPKPLFASKIVDCIHECFGEAEYVPEESPENDGPTILDYTGKCILLAEDVEINREIVLSLLEPTGVTVDIAEHGTMAVEKFTANPDRYALVFMDIHMPEMDGYEATRRIRALGAPAAKKVPIVAMTANVFREDIERCLAAGMNDHIGKPIDVDEFYTKLAKNLPE